MFAAQASGKNMIHREIMGTAAAVLAGMIIASQDLSFCQAHMGSRSAHQVAQLDDGWHVEDGRRTANRAAAIEQYFCFSSENQGQRPLRAADIERFEVHIQ